MDGSATRTVQELAGLLRQLRRREARARRGPELTYREIEAATGASRTVLGSYLTGAILPPTDRFDRLVRLFGATPAEQGALATLRDQVEEGARTAPSQPVPGRRDAPVVVPRQLPPPIRGFAGRRAELAALIGLADEVPGVGDGMTIAVIDGTPGVGKSTLAVSAAHLLAQRFPDGQLYVNLQGFQPAGVPPVRPGDAICGFLDALGIPADRMPSTIQAQTGLYRSILASRRVLVLLDNARDAAQVRPLLPGTAGALVLVTSRNRLSGLVAAQGAHALTLDLLTDDDARELLLGRLGPGRLSAESGAARDIIARCGRLPLALSVVAARAAAPPQPPLAVLAADLQQVGRGLDALDGGEPAADVRSVLSWSVRQLGVDAARLLRLLGLHPGPDIGTTAAASLAGLSVPAVRRLLGELSRANLLAERTPGRYCLHDVLRAYASELAQANEAPAQRRAAMSRCLDHYLHTARDAAMLLDEHRAPIGLAPRQALVMPEQLVDYESALAWFRVEHPALMAVLGHAAETGQDTHTWQLAWTLVTFLDRQGRWVDLVAAQRAALAAAGRLADQPGQARALGALGRAYAMLGRLGDADTALHRALSLYGQLGDRAGLPCTHLDLACLRSASGQDREALGHAEQALEIYRVVAHPTGHARALNAVGTYQGRLGGYDSALRHLHRAREAQQATADRRGEQGTWHGLGSANHRLGRYDAAADCYRRAADLCHDLGDSYYEAAALRGLGRARQAAGDVTAAEVALRDARIILDELRDAAAPGYRWDTPRWTLAADRERPSSGFAPPARRVTAR